MFKPILGVLGLMSCAAGALAQEAAGPPPVISVGREEIKPGRMAAHGKLNSDFIAASSRLNIPGAWIGLEPVSGDDNVVIFISAFGSFAEMESERKQGETATSTPAAKTEMDAFERQGADVHANQRTMLARHRADLSYRPGGMAEAAKSRYFSISTIRVKAGRTPDWVDYVKSLNAAREKANIDAHGTIYQVVSGAPAGTFLVFTGYRSLKELDENLAKETERQKAIDEALGGAVIVERRRQLISEIIADNTSAIFAMNPKISRPNAQFAAFDPEFWTPKTPTAAKALAVKKDEKPKP